MAVRSEVPDDDLEELRLAVVMNGGVSLAIWIGGVSQEINRLTQSRPGDGSVYGGLLDLVRATARVDVVAGTSAGGINGAFLALATVYGSDLGSLGKLWADKGGFLDLLRPATAGDPPSLLKGDDYFLPALRDAFDSVAPPGRRPRPVPPEDAPIDLVMTTSLMNGTLKTFVDDFGNPIVEVEHKGQFRFTRSERHRTDPFADENITGRLALAARSTASFPIAFEPSYIPVNGTGDDLHPDMAGSASWDRSRFVLDGGVLVNKPVGPALDAVLNQPADRQVRRVLAYVVPDPGVPKQAGPDERTKPPGAGRVLADTMVSLPRAQSIAEELADLRAHNKRARDAQALRPEVTPLLGPEFETLAPRLFPTYRLVRARRAVSHVADIVGALTAPPPAAGAPPAWTRRELLEAFGCAGAEVLKRLPFVPGSPDVDAAAMWDWGLAPAERIARVALDILRRAMLAAPYDAAEVRADLRGYRRRAYDLATTLRAVRRGDDAFWIEQALRLGPPPADTAERAERLDTWAGDAVIRWPVTSAQPPGAREAELHALELTTRAIVDLLVEARPVLRKAVDLAEDDPEAERLSRLLDGFGLTRRKSRTMARDVLRRIIAGEIALLALGVPGTEGEQPVDLVQVSGDTPNAFGAPTHVAAKLAGVQMGHFGAFYKKSWRVNDWIWGRCDGAVRLAQIVLGPARLRQLRLTRDEVLEEVERLAAGPHESLRRMYERDQPQIEAELAFLDDPAEPLPPSLPVTTLAIARRIQAELLVEELPALAAAVDIDLDAGGARGNGVAFRRAYETEPKPFAPDRALALFANAGIADELAGEEAGTDLFAVTASRAMAVGVSAADAKNTGLGPLRVLTRAVRGVGMTAYGLVYAATRRSKIGTAVHAAILAVGGALLALALAGDAPGVVKGLATVLVLGAVVEALLRAKVWELAAVLGVPFTAILAVTLARDDWSELRERSGPVVTVVALVVGLMLLGSVRPPSGPPRLMRWQPRAAWFFPSLAATLAVSAWMRPFMPGLSDYFRLQLAFTDERAASALERWARDPGLTDATTFLRIDFLYMALYWVPLVVAVGWAADRYRAKGRPRAAKTGVTFGWLPLYVVAFDAVENVFTLLMVKETRNGGIVTDWLVPLASTAATWKWLLLVVVVAYVIRALFIRQRASTTAS